MEKEEYFCQTKNIDSALATSFSISTQGRYLGPKKKFLDLHFCSIFHFGFFRFFASGQEHHSHPSQHEAKPTNHWLQMNKMQLHRLFLFLFLDFGVFQIFCFIQFFVFFEVEQALQNQPSQHEAKPTNYWLQMIQMHLDRLLLFHFFLSSNLI